jgi:hypothetical protein
LIGFVLLLEVFIEEKVFKRVAGEKRRPFTLCRFNKIIPVIASALQFYRIVIIALWYQPEYMRVVIFT